MADTASLPPADAAPTAAPAATPVPATAPAAAPAPVTFSDGTTMSFLPGTSPQTQQAMLDAVGAKHAAMNDAPVSAGDYVYSATRRYQNSGTGPYMAWLDHNAGGNWMNRNIADPLNAATGDAAPATLRMATRAETAIPDLAAQVYNVGKNAAGYQNLPSAPILGDAFLKSLGVGEASSPYQRFAENVASGMMKGSVSSVGDFLKSAATNTAATGGGMIGGEVGQRFGGDVGGLAGGFLGGGGGVLGAKSALYGAAPLVAHPNAKDIYRQAQESDVPVNFKSLASPLGQRVANFIGSIPILGSPIEKADEATRQALQNTVREQAEGIAGPGGIPPTGASKESIGQSVVQNAQDAVQYQKAQENKAWAPVNQVMPGAPVDVAPVANDTEQMVAGNKFKASQADAARNTVREMTNAAPGGTDYDEAARGAPPTLPQPTANVPWELTRQVMSDLNNRIGQGDTELPDKLNIGIKNSLLDAQRQGVLDQGVNPAQFDVARNVSAQVHPILKKLYPLSGQPIGDTGDFRNPKGAGQAFNWFESQMNSPENLAPLVDSKSPAFRQAAGQYISTLGGPPDNWRPEHFARDYRQIGDDVRSQLTQMPTGGPSTAAQHLENAAAVGSNFVTPTSRFGLTKSLGASWAASKALEYLTHIAGHTGIPGLEYALPPAAVYGLARGLESQGMKRAMAGQSSGIASDIYNAIPRFAAINRLNQVGNPSQ